MALNYSQRPIFPAHTSEDNLLSPLRIVNGYVADGMTEKGGEGYARPKHANGEIHDCFGYGRDKFDKGGSLDPVSADIIDLLPTDPFGMDIDISSTFTAITGWLADLEVDYGAYVRNNIVNTNEDYGLFAGLNLIWNSAMRFQSFPNNEEPDDKGGAGCSVRKCMTGCQFRDAEVDSVIHPINSEDDIMSFDHGSTSTLVSKNDNILDGFDHSVKAVGGDPHEAFVFALSYLGTRDLLFTECVCRSLCTTIRNDSLLWRSICIDLPLSERITDDILVQLTSRAEGNLLSLTLLKCPRITDDGLRLVLEANPKLTKLSIPGCTRLSSEGILNNLKAFKTSKSGSGIKHIRCGGFYGITYEQFVELKSLLGTDGNMQQNDYTPHYYHRGNLHLPSDDDHCDIDIDICPRCQNVRLVYDCPAESCQVKHRYGADLCRACVICIPRCVKCGRCLHDSEYEETFSLEYLCSGPSGCLTEPPRCLEEEQQMDVDVALHG